MNLIHIIFYSRFNVKNKFDVKWAFINDTNIWEVAIKELTNQM